MMDGWNGWLYILFYVFFMYGWSYVQCVRHIALTSPVCPDESLLNSCPEILYISSLLPFPSPIPTPSAPNLSLPQQALPPPLLPLRIHIPRRLHRDARPRPLGRDLLPAPALQLRHVDVFARVELERRLRARDLEVQARRRVRQADEGAQGQGARVERDDAGRVEDEAVVEGRGGGAEEEGRVRCRGGGVRGDGAGGDGVGSEGEVLVRREGDGVAVDGGGGGVEVEVAGFGSVSRQMLVVARGGGGFGFVWNETCVDGWEVPTCGL